MPRTAASPFDRKITKETNYTDDMGYLEFGQNRASKPSFNHGEKFSIFPKYQTMQKAHLKFQCYFDRNTNYGGKYVITRSNLLVKSFTSDLSIEAAEAYGKRLKSRDGILIIHGEDVFSDFSKLKNDVLVLLPRSNSILRRSNQLKILHRSNRYPSIEVQTPALQLFMPPGSLVPQYKQPFALAGLQLRLKVLHAGRFWPEERQGWETIQATVQKFCLRWRYTSWLDSTGWDCIHDALHSPRSPDSHNVLA